MQGEKREEGSRLDRHPEGIGHTDAIRPDLGSEEADTLVQVFVEVAEKTEPTPFL